MPRLKPSEAVAEAFLHDAHIVLGRQLDPFCLDHWITLDRHGSPLIHGGEVGITDLKLAVIVCSTRNLAAYSRFWKEPKWHEWIWQKLTRRASVEATLDAWNVYIDDHFPQFARWQSSESEPSKLPPFVVCCARFVRTAADMAAIRRVPLGEVIAWLHACNESAGVDDKSFMTDLEIEIVEEEEAKKRAETGANHGG